MEIKYRFFHRARLRAPVSVTWDVLTNHERLVEFTLTPVAIVQPGTIERNGLGCIRRLGALGWTVHEVVNIWRRFEVFGYHVIDSEEIIAHQGVVRFFPTSEGCEFVYDMQQIPTQKALDQAKASGMSYQDFMDTGLQGVYE